MTIEEQVKVCARDVMGHPVDLPVKLTDSLTTDLGADSLDMIEFVMSLEEVFEISIDDAAFENLDTVQQYVDLVTTIKGNSK